MLKVGLLLVLATAGFAQRVWTEDERRFLIQGLDRTRNLVIRETEHLSAAQWQFQEAHGRWSIAGILEHLGLQEDMYFREIYLISQQPPQPQFRERVKGKDAVILAYATDPEKGQAVWYLEPQPGRWRDPADSLASFLRSRSKLTEFVSTTKVDLRICFTFRDYSGSSSQWSLRDLHQLMLTTVAHTERHVGQIRRVKAHPKFPQ